MDSFNEHEGPDPLKKNLFSINLYPAGFREQQRDTKIIWKIHLVNFYINYSWLAGFPNQEKH